MKQVFYTKVMIEGFQSFGNRVIFSLDRQGINLVRGENGRGKSTLFNAIYWCEYGVNLKKTVETYETNRPADYKGTRVIVERTDGTYDYRIVRHSNYKGTTLGIKGGNSLMILKKPVDEPKFTSSHIVGDGLHKADMQEIIVKQLGVDSKIYLSSIFFGQRLKSLIDASDADKRVIFEELFNLDFIDASKERARERIQEATTALNSLQYSMDSAEGKILDAEEQLQVMKNLLKDFDTNKKARVKEATDYLEELQAELSPLPTKREELENEYKQYDLAKVDKAKMVLSQAVEADNQAIKNHADAVSTANKLERQYKIAEENIIKLKQDLTEVATDCPYCKGPLKEKAVSDVKKTIKEKIKAEEAVKIALDTNIKDATTIVKGMLTKSEVTSKDVVIAQDAYNKVSSGMSKANEILTEVKVLSSTMERLATQIEKQRQAVDKESKAEKPKVDLGKYEKIIQECEDIIATGSADIETKTTYITKANWWLKTGFGAGGLKSFVFNAMLAQLNLYAQKYAERLGFRVEFSVDMTKASKPFKTTIYDGEYDRFYDDLSGGEKQRVNICIAFAMHDLVNVGNVNANILIMDELTENLDNRGIESFFDLVRQKAEDKSVFLITHSDIIDSLGCKSINITKDSLGNTMIE